VITIDGMAKKHRSGGASRHWKGDAVEQRPGDDAERAADRAEGNEPIRADVEGERLRHGDLQAQPGSARPRPPGDAESEEDEIAEIAEEHQARDAEEQPPRGKL
jgi:hypothetical protein